MRHLSCTWPILTEELLTLTVLATFSSQTHTASRLSLISSTFVLVFSANSDRQALVRWNQRRPRVAAADLTRPTGQPLSLSLLKLLKPESQPKVLIGKSLWDGMDSGHMQQPLISLDHISIPPLHPLLPSLILPHSVSHSANAAPINSPPRTTAPTTPTTPSCLSILPDNDKCNVSQFVQVWFSFFFLFFFFFFFQKKHCFLKIIISSNWFLKLHYIWSLNICPYDYGHS